jgi:hypothetical protein
MRFAQSGETGISARVVLNCPNMMASVKHCFGKVPKDTFSGILHTLLDARLLLRRGSWALRPENRKGRGRGKRCKRGGV